MILLLAPVAALLVFWPALGVPFQWDDVLILPRPEIAAPVRAAWAWIGGNIFLGHYTPLAWLSWALDRWCWGLDPRGFHLTNLLLHALNAGLVFRVAARLLRAARPGDSEEEVSVGAAAAALFFALHPLRVESVAWVAERRGLLSASFCLLAALSYWNGRAAPAAALTLAAVFSKETAMALPAVLTLLAWYPLGQRSSRRGLALLWAAGFLGAALGAWATLHAGAAVPLEDYGPHARIVQTFGGLWRGLLKTCWPSGLSVLYQLPIRAPLSAGRWASAAAGLSLTAAAFAGARRRPAWAAAWGAQALFLLPTAGLLQSGPQEAADRYTYLAGLSWAVLFGAAAAGLWRGARAGRRWAAAGFLAAAAVLGSFAGLARRQLSFWRTPESLWRRAVHVEPEADYAWCKLGEALVAEGRVEEALDSFKRSLSLSPTSAPAMYGAGGCLYLMGRPGEAVPFLRRTLALDPDDGRARRLLEKIGP